MTNDKFNQFIIKLIKLTKNREVTWESYSPKSDILPNGEYILDKIYKTHYVGRDLKLYRYKYKYYIDELTFEWLQRIRLELIDSDGKTDYEFEFINSMNDLYDIVREQNSSINEYVNNILGFKLEILKAEYYTKKQSFDVTDKLNSKIENNRLIIVANNEISGDPDHGISKKLWVKYKFAGKEFVKEIDENHTLNIP